MEREYVPPVSATVADGCGELFAVWWMGGTDIAGCGLAVDGCLACEGQVAACGGLGEAQDATTHLMFP
jgi:hypothetical protein